MERQMKDLAFDSPVTVLAGIGLPHKILDAFEAFVFLDNYPKRFRKRAHEVAFKACKAVLSGDIDADLARAAFQRFAERSHLAVPPSSERYPAQQQGSLPR